MTLSASERWRCIRVAFFELTSTTSKVAFAAILAVAFFLAAPIGVKAAENGKQDQPKTKQGEKSALPEIIVTSEYRAVNLQKTPISMTAVTGQMLEQRSIDNIIGVANAAPNVLMRMGSTGSGMSNAAYIRGIGQGDFLFAYSPKISFYIDDVYFSTVYGSTFDLMDVSRVEVLRGPQGTLFGRNAVGGAIRIFSKKPQGDGSGYVQATGGNYSRLGVKGAIDVALVPDKLFARISILLNRQDGWVNVLNFACVHPNLAGLLPAVGTNTSKGCKVGTLGGTRTAAVRTQFRWIINDDIEDNIIADYTDERDDASPDTLTAAPQFNTFDTTGGPTPGDPNLANGLGVWFSTIGGPKYNLPMGGGTLNGSTCFFNPPYCVAPAPTTYNLPSAALQAALYPNNPHISYAAFGNPGLARPGSSFLDPNVNNLKQWGVSNELTVNFADSLSLKSVTAYREYNGVFGSSQASLPVPTQEAFQGVSHWQFSEELTFNGNLFDNKLEWTVGGFFLNTKEWNTGRVQFAGFAINGAPYVQDFLIDDPATLHNRSAFVHGVFHFNDKLSLEAGVRYSYEKKTYTFTRLYSYYLGIPDPSSNDIHSQGTGQSVDKINPRAALDYQITPDILLYTSFSTGFTAGGINGRPFSASDIFPYKPENVKAYEVGFKSQLFKNLVRLNGAVYYSDYTDIQTGMSCFLQFSNPQCHHPFTIFFTGNGGDAHIKGFELELEAHPVDRWLITASVGFTDFNYYRVDPQATGSISLSSPQTQVPKWTVAFGTQYDINLGNAGTLTPRIDVNFRSTIYFNALNLAPIWKQSGYALANARVTWRPKDSMWSLSGAITNLFDKLYYTQKFDARTGFGYATGTVGRPREWTIQIRRDF